MSEESYEVLCKVFSAVPERTKEELESILGRKFMGYASGNFSDFKRQKQKGSTVTEYNAVDEIDEVGTSVGTSVTLKDRSRKDQQSRNTMQ